VGAAFFPGHGDDAEALVRRASIAAREGFRRDISYSVYDGATARENPARLALASDLRSAIETRQLVLHYQPKVRLADGAHCGSEALVRWQHPGRGMVPPMEFVALAEEIGLIRSLTYQVLDIAVRQQHAWAGALPIAVNLSARNLYDPSLLASLDGLFGTWGVPRELIHFEITESALVDDPQAAQRALLELRSRGAELYIDDFGTGYSSLSYLVKLPVQALKIDRSFIREMGHSAQARGVVASIISMAHNLGLKVVAEGVETAADAALLREMACDEAQGYFFARPLAAAAYEMWRPGSSG
jgi:EAL domain-containing protein (putative c-di-GMP-specific phosphodiesterase class I)